VLSRVKFEMRVNLIIAIFLIASFETFSQSQKELNKLSNEAKDDVSTEFVVLKSGEKKNIKSIDFTNRDNSLRGKVEFADGSKMKLSSADEIIACYTSEATCKPGSYFRDVPYPGSGFGMSRTFLGKGLATRIAKGAINIYHLRFSYDYSEKGTMHYSYVIIRFFEGNNDGNLIEIKNDSTVWNKAAALVGKSRNAMKVIDDLRKSYGKIKFTGTTEGKLLEAIELYNKDAVNGKLE
jgi:hypothetical protein